MNRVMEIDGSGEDGVMVFWNPGQLPVPVLSQALGSVGMSNLFPKDDRVAWALKEVLEDFVNHPKLKLRQPGQPIKINPLRSSSKGCEAVRIKRGTTKNEHEFLISVVYQNGQIKVGEYNPHLVSIPASNIPGVEVGLTSMIDGMLQVVPTHMVSTTVARAIQNLSGSLIKETGGLWFLPGQNLDRFNQFSEQVSDKHGNLRIVTLKFALKPTESSYRMVLDAIRKEAAETLEQMNASLAELAGSKLRQDGIKTRLQTLKELSQKVALYESLLGVALTDIHSAVKAAEDAVATHNALASCA